MSTSQLHVPASQGDPNLATGVAQYLTPVVQNLVALTVNAKQAHWHIRGANFIGIHEFLDEVVEHAQGAADELAERIVALGLPVDARIETVAAKTTNPKLSDGFQPYKTSVKEIIGQIDATRETVTRAIKGLDDIDPVSQDLVIAVAQQLDKDRWFLYSHIAE